LEFTLERAADDRLKGCTPTSASPLKTIASLDQLSVGELARIRRTLIDRYDVGHRGNIIEIGFGAAEKNGAIDPQRSDAIWFFVTQNRIPRARADRVPAVEQVRVKRGRRFVSVELPTDVLEIDLSGAVLTGRRIEHEQGDSYATAGTIIAWRFDDEYQFHYGVLTVGHLFWDRDQVPEPTAGVVVRGARNRRIQGRLVLRSLPGESVDTALVEVVRQALVTGGLLAAGASSRGKRVRSLANLMTDSLRAGVTFPRRIPVPFLVLRYLPEFSLISELGTIDHVLDVRSQIAGAFGEGTSGAAWIIARQAACIQFAGWRSNRAGKHYLRGNGQALETTLDWCRTELAKQERRSTKEIEMRLIREL